MAKYDAIVVLNGVDIGVPTSQGIDFIQSYIAYIRQFGCQLFCAVYNHLSCPVPHHYSFKNSELFGLNYQLSRKYLTLLIQS
ncbi:MAG: hypothetical protein Q9M14_01145 [Mariprofundaceae bacterium]|nr:hypothetical protein [Mariprofundaceae bacterium]